MKLYKIDQYWEFTFPTQRFDTGAATDADSLPTYRVYECSLDGTPNDTVLQTGNAAKRDDANTAGYYAVRDQATAAAGYEVGKTYEVRVAATVNSVAGAAVVGRFGVMATAVWDALFGSGNLPAQVKAQDNIDFGALQKASLNAATPASVGSVTAAVTVTGKPAVSLAAGDVSGNIPADLQTIKARAVTDPGAGVAIGTNVAQVGSNMGTATVGGYAAGQDPATLLLTTPANKLATDAAGRVTTTYAIHKNTAFNRFAFVMTDETTGAPLPSLSVTAERSLDGGAFGSCANSVTEIANGFYYINLDAADLNANSVALRFSASGANDTDIVVITQA